MLLALPTVQQSWCGCALRILSAAVFRQGHRSPLRETRVGQRRGLPHHGVDQTRYRVRQAHAAGGEGLLEPRLEGAASAVGFVKQPKQLRFLLRGACGERGGGGEVR